MPKTKMTDNNVEAKEFDTEELFDEALDGADEDGRFCICVVVSLCCRGYD